MEKLNNSKLLTVTIVTSVILSAVVFGGGTYYLVNAKATKDKGNLQSQITDLNKKLADGQTNSAISSNPTMSNSNNPTDVMPATKITPLVVPTGYKLYTNSLYDYSFAYPLDHSVSTNDAAVPTDASSMVVSTPGAKPLADGISSVKAVPNLKLTVSSLEAGYSSEATFVTNPVSIGGGKGYEIDYDSHVAPSGHAPGEQTGSSYYVENSQGTVLEVAPEFASNSSRSGSNGLHIINKYFKLTN